MTSKASFFGGLLTGIFLMLLAGGIGVLLLLTNPPEKVMKLAGK